MHEWLGERGRHLAEGIGDDPATWRRRPSESTSQPDPAGVLAGSSRFVTKQL